MRNKCPDCKNGQTNYKCWYCAGRGCYNCTDGRIVEDCATCDGTGTWSEQEQKFYGKLDYDS